MRIGLIAAMHRSAEGHLRAELMFAGRSVLAWQVALLQSLGAERILCLAEAPTGEVLHLQHMAEAAGATFHALHGFAALPALVRAEDDLIVLRDGLVPDPLFVRTIFGGHDRPHRVVAAMPADHPLAIGFPEDFERIDAARNWAGVLAMRGASVQQLADFPADADAVSLLLRLALQAGTPCHDLTARDLAPECWVLADNPAIVWNAEQSLIAAAAAPTDWRAPLSRLAVILVRSLAPRGLQRGRLVAGALATGLLFAGVLVAALELPAAGLLLGATGAFSASVATGYSAIAGRLRREGDAARLSAALTGIVDACAALTAFFALAPWSQWQPLAALGPIVIGLARLVSRKTGSTLAATAADRASLLLALTAASAFGFLPEIFACLALGLLAALLLRADHL